jgi:hypothetical protein
MSDVIAIKGFEPGVFITINDVMTGVRKLARVTETGHAYHDLDTDTATAFPIWETLDPQEAGNILGFLLTRSRSTTTHLAHCAKN